MALPAEWATRTVERIYKDWDGNPMAGSVTFVAAVPVETNDETIVILPKPRTAVLDSGGKLSISLPVTDDTDMRNYGFTYQVTENLTYAAGGSYPTQAYNVPIPSGVGALQLGTLAPVPSNAGVVVVGGIPGKSAYDVAVDNGFVGTEDDWLESLEGPTGPASTTPGPPGPSAYAVWLEDNPGGTEADFFLSLKGAPGDTSGLAAVATTGSVNDLIGYVAPIPAGDTQTQGILAAKVLVACDYNTGTSTWDAAPDSRLRRVFQSTAANDPAALSQERDIWIVEAS